MKQVKTSQLCRIHLQESWTFKIGPSGRGQQGSDQEMMILWFHVLEIIASINILTNSPYWAFQLLVGQAIAIPPGTEFPVGNYFQLKNSCDHPRFTASHSSPSHRSWVKSLCTFPVSIIKMNKITLKWFLEASPTPRLPHPAGRTGQTGSFHVFLLFLQLLMKSSMQGSEDVAGGWHKKYTVHRYLHLDAIIFYEANDFSCLSCRLGMQSQVVGRSAI